MYAHRCWETVTMPKDDGAKAGRVAIAAFATIAAVLSIVTPRGQAAAQSTSETVAAVPETSGAPTAVTATTVVSRAIGKPHRGSLIGGVLLPANGAHHITWDPGTKVTPAPDYRHWGTTETVRRSLCVLDALRKDHPDWPRVVIGDLSVPNGGPFGREYGGLGHSSHQNGLDIDVYYPRLDRGERAPDAPSDVDFGRARELVERFVFAGADRIFVGLATPLRGPSPIVVRMSGHRDHFHVRFPNPEQPRTTTTTTTTTPTTTTTTTTLPSTAITASPDPTSSAGATVASRPYPDCDAAPR